MESKKWGKRHERVLRRAKRLASAQHRDLWGQEARDRAKAEIADLRMRGKYFEIDAPTRRAQPAR